MRPVHKSIMLCLIGVAFLSSTLSHAEDREDPEPAIAEAIGLNEPVPVLPAPTPYGRCKNFFSSMGKTFVKMGTTVGLVGGGLWLGTEWVGYVTGRPHIGLSIYLDWDEMKSGFTIQEQKIIDANPRDVVAIVKLFNDKLSRHLGDTAEIFPMLNPKAASAYFKKNAPATDMCRHKAIILGAILHKLDIRAEIVTGSIAPEDHRGDHVWVYLPDLKMVADPTNDELMTMAKYEEQYKAKKHWGVIQMRRQIGAFFR